MSSKKYYRARLLSLDTNDPHTIELFDIFRSTLKPHMSYREFYAYYQSTKLDYIDVTFVREQGKTVAFCAAAFYKTTIGGKRYTIGRAATGVLPEYRGNMLPKWKLYFKYIRYKFFHPFSHIILSAYVANPIIYAMICKYTGQAYPKQYQKIPEYIIHIKDDLLRSQGMHKKEGPAFVVKIHFSVSMGKDMVARIYASKDRHLLFFLSINPGFREQYGVVTIIPVTAKNCFMSSMKFLYYGILKIIMKLTPHVKLIGDYIFHSSPSLRN